MKCLAERLLLWLYGYPSTHPPTSVRYAYPLERRPLCEGHLFFDVKIVDPRLQR